MPKNICVDEKGNAIICHFDHAVAYGIDGTVELSSGLTAVVSTSQSGDVNSDLDLSGVSFGKQLIYRCPESLCGVNQLPGKSDVFSVGVIAYQLINSIEVNPYLIEFDSETGEFLSAKS